MMGAVVFVGFSVLDWSFGGADFMSEGFDRKGQNEDRCLVMYLPVVLLGA